MHHPSTHSHMHTQDTYMRAHTHNTCTLAHMHVYTRTHTTQRNNNNTQAYTHSHILKGVVSFLFLFACTHWTISSLNTLSSTPNPLLPNPITFNLIWKLQWTTQFNVHHWSLVSCLGPNMPHTSYHFSILHRFLDLISEYSSSFGLYHIFPCITTTTTLPNLITHTSIKK